MMWRRFGRYHSVRSALSSYLKETNIGKGCSSGIELVIPQRGLSVSLYLEQRKVKGCMNMHLSYSAMCLVPHRTIARFVLTIESCWLSQVTHLPKLQIYRSSNCKDPEFQFVTKLIQTSAWCPYEVFHK